MDASQRACALRLADELIAYPVPLESATQASYLLRELAAEPKRAPLTKDQIDFLTADAFLAANGSIYSTRVYDFVRAVERAHGIV